MKILTYLLIPFAALFTSCSTTPETRIQRNPEMFSNLSTKHKDLVRQGKITRDMTKPAVFIAMGHPDNKTSGVQHGKSFERWNYNVLVPVYNHGYSPHYGYGYRRYGYGRGYYDYYPSVQYVPRRGSTIEFSKDKVTGWTGLRSN